MGGAGAQGQVVSGGAAELSMLDSCKCGWRVPCTQCELTQTRCSAPTFARQEVAHILQHRRVRQGHVACFRAII